MRRTAALTLVVMLAALTNACSDEATDPGRRAGGLNWGSHQWRQ